jgi:hypothetical protein
MNDQGFSFEASSLRTMQGDRILIAPTASLCGLCDMLLQKG